MKRVLFIYNPYSGKGLLKPVLSDVVDLFVKSGAEVVIYPTQDLRDGLEKVKHMDATLYDVVVCSGGDGTLDEVVTGMMARKREDRIPIGYIPTGTTNDFANSLHIPSELMKAADIAMNGQVFPCDVGGFNDGTFVYIAAFGIFTDVSYETKQEVKNVLGHLAYVLEGAKRIFNIPTYKMKVTYDDGEIEDEFVYGMVTNSRSVGGFRNMVGSQNVCFDDGVFEVTLVKTPKNPIELQAILASLMINEVNTEYVITFKAHKISFETVDEVPWTLDGEFGGSHSNVVIENKTQEIGIMVPEEYVEVLSCKGNKEE